MNDKEVIQKFQDLQYTHAPHALHEEIAHMVDQLPAKHTGFYFPLFAFQMSLVGVVILVLVGLGSGVVLAAKGSEPGTPLYHVRQFIQKVVPYVAHDAIAVPSPTATPHVVSPTPHVDRINREKEIERSNEQHPSGSIHKEKEVEGAHDERKDKKEKLEDVGNIFQDAHDK